MRAVVMTAVGGPEVLKLVELPTPELEGDERRFGATAGRGHQPGRLQVAQKGDTRGIIAGRAGLGRVRGGRAHRAGGNAGTPRRRGLFLRRRVRADAGDVRRTQSGQ